MNKRLGYSLAAALLAVTMLGNEASALSYKSTQRPIEIILDGQKIKFHDSRPVVSTSGTTYVPIRVVSEQLGAKVTWDARQGKAVIAKGDSRIELTESSKQAMVNGTIVALDAPMVVQNGRTLVPLRFVSEALQVEVKFDDKSYYIFMKSNQYDESAKYDPYGRKIRTTNLPKNAQDFPYILEDIPNEMYEMELYKHPYLKERYKSPVVAHDHYALRVENVNEWRSRVEKYYALLLNVNYRFIDYNWAKEARNLVNTIGTDSAFRNYVDWVKNNNIQIEGGLIAEPSMVYHSGENMRMRAKIRFKIKNYKDYKSIIHDQTFHLEMNDNGKLPRYQKNVWYEGYVDVQLSSNVSGAAYSKDLMVAGTTSLFLHNAIIKEQK
ncbi:copper amine oxidase N-terminal domain-containing protein [Paenibacillus aquistagni]|uniref:copper amine oxidase N-terminal domain-containing protein n=1 Tax=Paenibacillus aquistagni TaxID=1852522 RepID=UPI000B5105BD|nr:copper amine oxidase N-terminal domain-containing protein [Paenibacillus aquistagni]